MPRAAATHTYDESCICYVPDTPSSLRNESDQLPLLRAQYFYLASFDIDDVFTPQPPVQAQSSQDGRRVTVVATLPPQPFSAHDNAALDKAWGKRPEQGQAAPRAAFAHPSLNLSAVNSFARHITSQTRPAFPDASKDFSAFTSPARNLSRRMFTTASLTIVALTDTVLIRYFGDGQSPVCCHTLIDVVGVD
ncbi:hypothetical protein KEM52_001386 [Ascosphaera acerosa]|nr:hypothetical protein KEM52_001386 [Ascosphaera acerosa]